MSGKGSLRNETWLPVNCRNRNRTPSRLSPRRLSPRPKTRGNRDGIRRRRCLETGVQSIDSGQAPVYRAHLPWEQDNANAGLDLAQCPHRASLWPGMVGNVLVAGWQENPGNDDLSFDIGTYDLHWCRLRGQCPSPFMVSGKW